MKKTTLIILALATSFSFGFAFKSIITKQTAATEDFKKVTGIGGIFFKCKDPKNVKEWYHKHLGLETDDYGACFTWYEGADSTKKGMTQWSPFKETTKYFGAPEQRYMINYRVENLVALVEQLKKDGVTIADSIEADGFGKFVHIMDVEGNKVELWEPGDSE